MARRADRFRNPESPLYFETRERVTRVFFNRPEKLNPFDWDLSNDFAELIQGLKKEPSDVVVLTGKGRAFSAGADLAFLEDCTRAPEAKVRVRMKQLYGNFLKIRELSQVTIAQVNGAVAGGGLGLVLACDLRTVLTSAKFAFNFVKIGLSPGMGILYLSTKIFGEAKAREIWLRGRPLTGAQVADMGGATETAASPEELERVTESLAQEILGNGKLGMQFIKEELLWKDAIGAYLDFNCRHQAKCLKSPEAREGLQALRERREPSFRL